jgi:Protein of unknown function (DUF4235)
MKLRLMVSKALYSPLSIARSVTGGVLASALFGQIWKRLSNEEPAPPNPKDLSRSSGAVLLGAGLQGLVFGIVKAAVDRVGARGYNAITDDDPVVGSLPASVESVPYASVESWIPLRACFVVATAGDAARRTHSLSPEYRCQETKFQIDHLDTTHRQPAVLPVAATQFTGIVPRDVIDFGRRTLMFQSCI